MLQFLVRPRYPSPFTDAGKRKFRENSIVQAKCFLSHIRACSTAAAVAIVFGGSSLALSQPTAPMKDSPTPTEKPLPQFIAISIHPLKEDDTGWGGSFRGTTYRAHAYNAQMLIWEATGIHNPNRIKGMPAWAAGTKYDIEAKIDGSTGDSFNHLTRADVKALRLSILAARFNFAYHYETSDFPVLDLVIAKGGIKNMTPYVAEKSLHPELPCYWPKGTWDYIHAEGCTMKDLAKKIDDVDDFEVIDQTNLPGRYTFDLHYDSTASSWWVDGYRIPATYKENAEWPSIYSALTGQLGLKLIKGKASLPTLVIDSISPPTEN
jgi:uncharacterized protein (TIGR03435 family)